MSGYWKSVSVVEGQNETFVLQQRYASGVGTKPGEPRDRHRLVSITELDGVSVTDPNTSDQERIDLSGE